LPLGEVTGSRYVRPTELTASAWAAITSLSSNGTRTEITSKRLPDRRHRAGPRGRVKRARHNIYRVKKPDQPVSTVHNGPATTLIHRLKPTTTKRST